MNIADNTVTWKKKTIIVALVCLSFAFGWGGSGLAGKVVSSLHNFQAERSEASAHIQGDPRTFLVYHRNIPALEALANTEEDFIEIKQSSRQNLALIKIRDGAIDTINLIKSMNGFDSILYVPYLCH